MRATTVRRLQADRDAVLACQDNLEYMRPLKSGTMQLIITSPPYNIGKTYEAKSPLEPYVQAQAQVISECVRLLHPNGSLCWQVGNHMQKGEIVPLDLVLYPVFREHGLKFRNRVIWHFEHGLHCSKRCPAATKPSFGSLRATITFSTLMRLGCRRNTPERNTSRGRRRGGFPVIHSGKIRVTFGFSQTSRTITSRRQFTRVSSPLNL